MLKDPDEFKKWRTNGQGTGVVIQDRGRQFTTAAAVWALTAHRSMNP